MPARHYVLAILLFWTATTSWLFYRDLWPRLRSGEAPPFAIDLAYETQQQASRSAWQIHRGDPRPGAKPLGFVHSYVKYRDKDDTFELHSEIKDLDLGQIGPIQIRASRPWTAGMNPEPPAITGMYRVTREGQLREIEVEAYLEFKITGIERLLHFSAVVRLGGRVEGSQFIPHGSVELPAGGRKEDLQLEPVEFPSGTSILNPLHPVSRIQGLRRGKHWQLRLVDPLADSLAALAQKDPALQLLFPNRPRVHILQAEVLPEADVLVHEKQEARCFVIEYRGDNLTAHTWVRESDGKVLRQEATFWGERLVLERL